MTLLAITLGATGCAHEPPAAEHPSISEAQAIEIAREAVSRHETAAGALTFEAKQRDDGWMVFAFQPYPCGFRAIRIDGTGNVTEYVGDP